MTTDDEAERAEAKRMGDVLSWIESWVSYPAESYTTSELDVLFARTREHISRLRSSPP